MSADYAYDHSGRNRATLVTVLAVWGAVGLAFARLDIAPWIAWLALLATLPAVWDLATNRRAGLRMDRDGLRWFAGRREGEVAWRAVARVRLDTRLDLSVRAALVLHTGRKVRIPQEATPPHREFEAALEARGITVERHHFSLMG